MLVIEPTALEVRPSDFNSTLWQRIRKLWLLPSLIPSANSLRCAGLSKGVFTRPIMETKIQIIKLFMDEYLYHTKDKKESSQQCAHRVAAGSGISCLHYCEDSHYNVWAMAKMGRIFEMCKGEMKKKLLQGNFFFERCQSQ
jgi:hypothetical protein